MLPYGAYVRRKFVVKLVAMKEEWHGEGYSKDEIPTSGLAKRHDNVITRFFIKVSVWWRHEASAVERGIKVYI